ncbi:XkdX family protein [Fructobacillus fructosus]|nr:XkdX family protein [Fructobacillus fructosus]MBC9119388.1 XkdX family protein [Fructobacillus fructosus]MBD9366847.1 XkdX family protein [Leuconostoc mesenteroides]
MFDILKDWYTMGALTAEDLLVWVKGSVITQYDYQKITGKEYPA